ncbi:hypothetical protein TNIN_9171 [Trichonephila inaurata madagascariensis]|uniref:Uncharacterized protein n=1 Tax=Trichonephila inaurata madagascariensis TaxID=2747483 RepID=A0A8X6I2Z8_9ARAC|nr:hypothetical protein TNIN_9171 [Trichonephila inaurata madagascariensis]
MFSSRWRLSTTRPSIESYHQPSEETRYGDKVVSRKEERKFRSRRFGSGFRNALSASAVYSCYRLYSAIPARYRLPPSGICRDRPPTLSLFNITMVINQERVLNSQCSKFNHRLMALPSLTNPILPRILRNFATAVSVGKTGIFANERCSGLNVNAFRAEKIGIRHQNVVRSNRNASNDTIFVDVTGQNVDCADIYHFRFKK